ncbi:MAG TPA: methyltransferase domain-containing protein [Clostridiaceae bacterium]
MSFYDELSKVYDVLFPEDEVTSDFLESRSKVDYKVLDIACGTGSYAKKVALTSMHVDGIDLDNNMIKLAKEGLSLKNVEFYQGDMTKIKELFEKESYGLVYCIGNSIVHLENISLIERLFEDVYNLLIKDGTFIVQIINFDSIIEKGYKKLPQLENEEKKVKFQREYKYKKEDNIMEFETDLAIKEKEVIRHYYNKIPLVPLKRQELLELYLKVGFKDIKLYGDFNLESFIEPSTYLVIEGTK